MTEMWDNQDSYVAWQTSQKQWHNHVICFHIILLKTRGKGMLSNKLEGREEYKLVELNS